jgi:DNA-binding CsgD family transcriptional regulator
MRWHPGSERFRPRAQSAQARQPLTARQREILSLLASGSSTKETAEALGISPATVLKHTLEAERRLRTTGRKQTIATAFAAGEIDLPADRLPALVEPLLAQLEALRGPEGQPFFPTDEARDRLAGALLGREQGWCQAHVPPSPLRQAVASPGL